MSAADRDRWNTRYASAGGEPRPRAFLVAAAAVLPRGGRALDLACGRGAEARWLAERGLAVDAVDISDVAIDAARAAGPADDRDATRRAGIDSGLDTDWNAGPDIDWNAGPDIDWNADPDIDWNADPDAAFRTDRHAEPDADPHAGPRTDRHVESYTDPDTGRRTDRYGEPVAGRIRYRVADLDAGLPAWCNGPYDVVCALHFRGRVLEEAIETVLAPGGVVVATRLSVVGRRSGDADPAFLADPGELVHLAQRHGLAVVTHEEGDGEARLVARRPGDGGDPQRATPVEG